MDFLISSAWAQGTPAAGGADGGLLSFVPLILIFLVFYFMLMRPQIKRAKEHKKMVESMTKNDEIVTNGGLVGKIHKIDDNFVVLEVADGVRVKVQRNAVASLLPKGTLKDKDNDA